MKKKIILASLIIVLIILFGSHQTPSVISTLSINGVKIIVEIADTETTRAQGLSNRLSLTENAGLLFIFNRADYYSFWMKEMNFPIDIIWLDDNWRIVDITANASPQDFPQTYQPRAPARYVLEVNAGFIVTHDIVIGAQAIRH